jgi:hypothetical protein
MLAKHLNIVGPFSSTHFGQIYGMYLSQCELLLHPSWANPWVIKKKKFILIPLPLATFVVQMPHPNTLFLIKKNSFFLIFNFPFFKCPRVA